MNRSAFLVSVVVLGLFASRGLAGPAPKVAKTIPVNGATDVDPKLTEIVVVFDIPVKMNSWSLVFPGEGKFPEMTGDTPISFRDNKTCVIKVKLGPDTAYGLGLNSKKRQGFKSAEDGTPAVPFELRFKTGSGKAPAAPDGPRVVKTDPPAGATGLEPGTFDLTIVFSEPMKKGEASIMSPPEGPRLKLIGKPRWQDARTFVVPIMLPPATTYRLGINSGKTKRFVSAGDGTPAVPHELTFSTQGAKSPPVTEAEKKGAVKVPLLGGKTDRRVAPGPRKAGPVQLRYDYRKGDTGRVMQRNIVDIKLKLSNGQTVPVVSKSGLKSIEEVLDVAEGKPAVVRKMISEFLRLATDDNGQLQAAPKLEKGAEVKLDRRSEPTRVERIGGEMPEELMAMLAEDVFPDVVPATTATVGKAFGLAADTIAYLKAEFGSQPSDPIDIKLTCRGIGPKDVEDARNAMYRAQGGGQPITYVFDVADIDIDWKQDGRLPNGVGFTLTAKGKIAFAVEAGVLLKLDIDGKIRIKQMQVQDGNGQTITVTGDGTYAYKYDFEPLNWSRGVRRKGQPGGAPPKIDVKSDAGPKGGTDAAPKTWDELQRKALSTPRGSIVHQWGVLGTGDVDEMKKCFTDRVKDLITPEAMKKGQQATKETTLPDLIGEIIVDDEKGQCKIMMKNGRTLTWLHRKNGLWLSDNIWFK